MKQVIPASCVLLVIISIAVDINGSIKCQQGHCSMDCYQQQCSCENDAALNKTSKLRLS